jgi:ceramide glucosyltransferase
VLALLGPGLILLALAGAAFSLVSARAASAHVAAPRRRTPAALAPAVTLFKPLHGTEDGLLESLRSFCEQDYAGPVQIVFGVQDGADAAVPIVRELQRAYPGRDISLVVDGRVHGENRKVSNLVNMARAISHEIIVMSDSDIRVGRDYLDHVVERLSRPGVGFVTSLYTGEACRGVWSELSAMGINYQFLPNVVMGLKLSMAEPCFGATIALKRSVLAEIGGFEILNDQLADDYDLGRAIRRAGYAGEVAAVPVSHGCSETSLGELWRHEARWARTIRMIDGAGFIGQGFTYPLAWALLGCLASRFNPAAVAALLAVLASRLYVVHRVDGATGARVANLWLLPVRDLFSFAVFVSAFFGKTVSWRGRRYIVDRAGALSPAPLGSTRELSDVASHPLPAGALLRRLRRGGGLALPGQARDQVVLVSDLAGPAGRLGRPEQADRRPAA